MNRDLRRALEASPEGRAYIAKQKEAKSAARRRTAPRRAPGREAREAADAAQNEATARLRRQAVARAAGCGELCGEPFDSPDDAHMCHLDGGSGKRKQRQWIGNVLMEHPECHLGKNGLDRNPLRWLANVKHWAARWCYPVPERFRKLEALRAAQHPSPPATPTTGADDVRR